MKTKNCFVIIEMILCTCILQGVCAQQLQPSERTEKLKKFYNAQTKHEVSLDAFLKSNQSNAVESSNYNGCIYSDDACSGGNFEAGLDPTQWQGAYGTWGTGDPDPSTLTAGLLSGNLFDFNAHQTIVTTGNDSLTGIPMVPAGGGSQSLRLGNAIYNYGTELLSKTITVTAATTIFKFSYAVVFEDPDHPYDAQPAFSVRVFDCAAGQELTGICNLGNGSNKVVSDASNPFFQSLYNPSYGIIAYKNWTTAFVDLTHYIGKTVNIQFTNKDCGYGGHFGYTYLDNVCGDIITSGKEGSMSLDSVKTTNCGKGSVCIKYTLPQAADSTIGTAVFNLNIYQNGSLITSLSSGSLTADSSTYHFNIDPSTLGIDNSAGGFDYVITDAFTLKGFTYAYPPIGTPPEGQKTGANNDYSITCSVDTSCKQGCLIDDYGYRWRLCYKQDGTKRVTTKGVVNLMAGGIVWNATGWMDCISGKFELKAINPNADNCISGYTDSFVYRGTTSIKCHDAEMHEGTGTWKSYCSDNIVNDGFFEVVNCRSMRTHIAPITAPSPARSGGDLALKISPNPMRSSSAITYNLTTDSKVNIVVYNYMMQPVKVLVNANVAKGNHSITWDGSSASGSFAGSGIYKIVALINGQQYTTSVQVIK
jgi:hypothetical protein